MVILLAKYIYAIHKGEGIQSQLTVEDLKRHKDFINIKEHLYCPGEGCNARIDYRESGKGFYAKRRNDDHSLTCEYLEDGVVGARKIDVVARISGELSSKGIEQKHKYGLEGLKEYLNPQPQNDSGITDGSKKKGKKKTTSTEKPQKVAIIDPKAEQSEGDLDVLDDSIKTKEIPHVRRLLHRVSEKDITANINLIGEVDSINLSDQTHGVITGSLGGVKGKIDLPEVFFVGHQSYNSTQLYNFLNIINDYIQRTEEIIHFIILCYPYELDKQPLEFSCFDPEAVNFIIKGTRRASIQILAAFIQTESI